MKYIQALKEQGYNLKTLPTDIKKAVNLVLKSKDYNSKVEALDYITFNSIRNSQPVDERLEELHKLSLTDHSVEDNNGFNTPLSIEIAEEQFASGGHIATKDDNNKVREWKVRFHLARGENFMNWKVENPKTKEVHFYKPDEVQIEMFNCKLTNSPSTAKKIFTGEIDKSPIAWVVCEKYKISKKIDPVDADERLTYNPRTAPNWFDTEGDNVDNYVFEKLITFGRGVYYETPDGKLYALGGLAEQEELFAFGGVSRSKLFMPNVRGGWTKEKIIRYFKEHSSDTIGTPLLAKYISEFNNWEDFKNHIYYHGTTNYIEKGLKPSMAFSERWIEQQGGGGYGDRYFGISLTKRKRTAESFSGQYSSVSIYPVILKKDAVVIERTDLKDASEIEDIIVELYEKGIDAVWIGGGEEELVVVNPFAILLYKKGRESHSVYGGFKSIALTDEKIKEIYDNSLKIWTDYQEAKSKTTTKEERNNLLNSVEPIQFETGGETKKSGKDIYENDILQIRIIGGEPNYYKRVNQEWKFLSPDEIEKLKTGTKHELEHFGTIEAFKRRDIPNETIASFIAYDHINEDPNYYQKLDKAIPEQMAEGKKIDEFPVVTLEIYANNQNFYKTRFNETAFIDVKNEKIKFNALDTFGEDYRMNWIKVKENSNGYYIDYDYFGGRIFIENWYWLCQENKPEKMENGKKISEKNNQLRHALESTISSGTIAQNTPYSKYDDVDALRSKMLEILKKEEGDNTYSTPYSMEALTDLRSRAYQELEKQKGNRVENWLYGSVGDFEWKVTPVKFEDGKTAYSGEIYWNGTFVQLFPVVPDRTMIDLKVSMNRYMAGTKITPDKVNKNRVWFNGKALEVSNKVYDKVVAEQSTNQPTPEPTPEPTAKIKEPEMEENTQTGSVSNWNEVPVRWKNVKAIRPTTFNLNPYDKGLNSLIKDFVGSDDLRPVMTAMNFSESGVVCTDAHKLLHIHYKHSDFKGNYATANTLKVLKGSKWREGAKDIEDATKQIKEDKYPNWEAVVPRENPYIYEVDIMKLYQYLNVAINYANKTTNQVAFRYDNGRVIGFNGKFFMACLEVMMKMQKCTKVFLHLSEPSRAMLISYEKNITPTGNTFCLLMPVMVNRVGDLDSKGRELKITQILGANDPDFNKSLSCYFDFEDSQIHNGNGSIADYKESYGDTKEMPLALITMLDKFIKTSKSRLAILNSVCVDGNGIRVDNLDARIEIANDWEIPNGIYAIENNAMVLNTLNGNIEDFPKLNSRVQTKEPIFKMNADVFKFYVSKAFEHSGEDDLKPIMKCILLQNDQGGQLQMVSTDAYSLFHSNLTKYASDIKNQNFKYPLDFVNQLINFSKNIDVKEIGIYVDENKKYRIDAGRLHFEAKLGDGLFPNWEAIMPKGYTNQISFNLKDLFVCMNNEVAKSFVSEENLKKDEISIFNQGDKIFISNLKKPFQNFTPEHKSKEICSLKIQHETFDVEKSFFFSNQNFILLMPQMWTNGNLFNWAVEPFSDVIASIGKEKVIVNYTDLNRAYIFTSDNLDYKTSDVYKPEKAVTTPVKEKPRSIGKIKEQKSVVIRQKSTPAPKETKSVMQYKKDQYGRMLPTEAQIKMSNRELPEISQKIKDQIVVVEKQHNMQYDKNLLKKWDYRYIQARRKLFSDWKEVQKVYGKSLSDFKVGDIVGTLGRNSDSDRYVILEFSKDMAYILPYNYAYPSVSELSKNDIGWELIEPKKDLVSGSKVSPAPKKSAPSPKREKLSYYHDKQSGDILDENEVLDITDEDDLLDSFVLIGDFYSREDAEEKWNSKNKPKQPISKAKPSPVVSKMLGTGKVSPASKYINSIYELQAKYVGAKTQPEKKKLAVLINVELGQLKKMKNNELIKSVSAWLKSVEDAIKSTEQILAVKERQQAPIKPKEDTQELEKAIKGLEVYLKNFGSVKESSAFKEWNDLKVAIKGLKALLK